jgi:hypothetical protein
MIRSSLILAALFCIGSTAACVASGDEVASEQDETTRTRGDAVGGSCKSPNGNSCGKKSNGGTCWCDDKCSGYGDCCDDVAQVCDAPAPKLCLADSACAAGEVCDHSECLSGCAPGKICPAVCYGQCVVPEPCPGGGEICQALCSGGGMPDMPESCPIPACNCQPPGDPCGDNVCGAGEYCCNESCGICAPEGGGCIKLFCQPEPEPTPAPSCAGNCGGAAPDKSCYCDAACTQYGDCCGDYAAQCG